MQKPNILLGYVVAATLAVAAPWAWAQVAPPQPSVSISDLTDGLPTVDVVGLEACVITSAPEEAWISGIVPVQGNGLAPGNSGVFLLEPAADPLGPRVSDFLTLTVGNIMRDPVGGAPCQTVQIFFQSDGALNFDQNVASLSIPTPLPSILEDGTLQDLSGVGLLNSGYLTIKAQSDYDSVEVPDGGSTGVLLGLAALVLGNLSRGRKL